MKLKLAFTVFLLVGTIEQLSAETPALNLPLKDWSSIFINKKTARFFRPRIMVWSINIFLNAWRNLFGKMRCRQKVKCVRWTSTPVTTLKRLISKSSRSESPTLKRTQQK